MLSVVHICESDGGGGAFQAAYKLHSALRAVGVDGHMYVATKTSFDPTVTQIIPSSDVISRLRRRFNSAAQSKKFKVYERSRKHTLEVFSQGRGRLGRDLVSGLPDADIYNLHWSSQLVDFRLLFKYLGREKPLVWRLPDMNAMTGGCHYALGCENFVNECGMCPQIGSDRRRDLANQVWRYKETALNYLDPKMVRIVGPSKWIVGEAKRSSLLNRFDILHIPTGVDVQLFSPRDKIISREVFGIPTDQSVVLFTADTLANHRKGFDLLLDSLNAIPESKRPLLVAVGSSVDLKCFPPGTMTLGRITEPRLLSFAYSAADVFVLPTRADNLPNVVLESMACGVPVVAFDVGGLPEIVRFNQTGILAEPENSRCLSEAICDIISNKAKHQHMSAECRRIAEEEFSSIKIAESYRDLYETLVHAKLRSPPSDAWKC